MTSGIFQKTCPACATLIALETECCECGYAFDANPEIASAAQEAVEEELFEAYLTARVDQALAALLDARRELADAPGNFDKASYVMRRVNELNVLRNDIEAQRAKTAAARERLDLLRAAGSAVAAASESPTEAFRAAQAVRAQLATEGGSARTCPSCQAPAADDAALCACGYRFEPTLAAARGTALRDSTKSRD